MTKKPILGQEALEDLQRSGLDREDAQKLGIALKPDQYSIPYYDLGGEPTGFHRVRYVGKLPRDPKTRKEIRYKQSPGSAPRLYFPFSSVANWQEIADDPAEEIVITEGEKKAALACKHGVPTIGLGGVWSWRSDKKPIPDFDLIKWDKRPVAIVFDSDAATNEKVQLAEKKLAEELERRGAVVRVVRLPSDGGKVGLDDFILKHSIDALHRLLRGQPDGDQPMSFAELAKMEFPPLRWMLAGIMAEGLCVLAGPPKIGKSWLALNIATAVASGAEALGRKCEHPGAVLHLSLEDTPRRFQSRLKTFLEDAKPPKDAYFSTKWPKVEDGGLEKIRQHLKDHPDTALVIVDTLARIRPTAAAGKAADYTVDVQEMTALQDITKEFRVCVLVLHHTRKSAGVDPLEEVLGSQGITGTADTILVVKRQRQETRGTLQVVGRDIPEKLFAVEFDPERGAWTNLGEAADVNMHEARREIIEALEQIGHAATPKEVAELIPLRQGETKEKRYQRIKRLMLKMRYSEGLRLTAGKYETTGGGEQSKSPPSSSPEEEEKSIPSVPLSLKSPHSLHSLQSPQSPQSLKGRFQSKRGTGNAGNRDSAPLKLKLSKSGNEGTRGTKGTATVISFPSGRRIFPASKLKLKPKK